VGQIEVPHRFSDMAWFFWIKQTGLAFANGAKAAVTSADVSAEHERRRPIRPTLKNVRTARFLTNGVKVQAVYELEHMILICRIAQPNLEPLRLWLARLGIVGDYSKFAGQDVYFLNLLLNKEILASAVLV